VVGFRAGGRPVVFPLDARGDWSKAAFLDAHGATEIPVERDAAAAVRRRQGAPGVGAPETATRPRGTFGDRRPVEGAPPILVPLVASTPLRKLPVVPRHPGEGAPPKIHSGALASKDISKPERASAQATLAELAADPGAADYVFAPDPLVGVDLAKATESRFFDDGKRFSRDAETRKRTALFFLGGRGSSTTYHEHSHAYNALFYGAKLWALLPPLAGDFRGGGALRGIPRILQKYLPPSNRTRFPRFLDHSSSLPKVSTTGERVSKISFRKTHVEGILNRLGFRAGGAEGAAAAIARACVESQPIQDTFNLSVPVRIFGGSLSSRRELGERIRTVQESWETSSI